jgi:glycosidase
MTSNPTSIPAPLLRQLHDHLAAIYPADQSEATYKALVSQIETFRQSYPELAETAHNERFSERDVLLITYGDQVQEAGKAPLQSLYEVLSSYTSDVLSGVHFLPFFPYTSDDGFSVVDYLQIDPALGTWDDIEPFREHFKLMFDFVINHISASSAWFQGFLQGDERYKDYFIVVDPSVDLSQVTRPRALPLLTPFETERGTEHVWTTFSADQVDLNFANPAVLLDMTHILLEYVARGGQLLRMDAVTYLWKTIGTNCVHLPETHRVVQLWRTVLDAVAPQTLIVTETNVPHLENISYFGNGHNEAQMVYQFPLAPLTFYSFDKANSSVLQQWASALETPSEQTTFFNFLASHDGIGLRPTEGILSQDERNELAEQVIDHGGFVSYKNNSDGSQSPYELNINYFDALNSPDSDESLELQINRFIASQAILLSLAGVPGIYVHSLFGSRNWREGVEQTGRNRTINREKFERARFEAELNDPHSLRSRIFERYRALIQTRTSDKAFHPNGSQQVIPCDAGLFCFVRSAPDGTSQVLCITSVSPEVRQLSLDLSVYGIASSSRMLDLISNQTYRVDADGRLSFTVEPYRVLWLKA